MTDRIPVTLGTVRWLSQEAPETLEAINRVNSDPEAPTEGAPSHAFEWYQRLELGRAREKHGAIVSLHAAYAIILEELDEFWDQVKLQEPLRDVPKMVEELTQIAAMCQRTFEDLKLNERYRPQ